MNNIKETVVNSIRILSAEGVQAANSGHPGLPMATAQPDYLTSMVLLAFLLRARRELAIRRPADVAAEYVVE